MFPYLVHTILLNIQLCHLGSFLDKNVCCPGSFCCIISVCVVHPLISEKQLITPNKNMFFKIFTFKTVITSVKIELVISLAVLGLKLSFNFTNKLLLTQSISPFWSCNL